MFSKFNDTMETIKTTSIVVGIVVIATVIIIALVKSEIARWILGSLLTLLLSATMVFSVIHLNKYYNTEGGVVGKIQSIFNKNNVSIDKQEDILTFDFSDIMLTQYNENEYRAEFVTDNYISLDINETYAVLCNGTPCEVIEYSDDYIIAEFKYLFLDEYKNEKLVDTLYFKFAFYGKSTRLIVITQGGQNAVSLWNSYFQKNDFEVTLNSVLGDYANAFELVDIDFKYNDTILKTITIRKGSILVLPDMNDRHFVGWSSNGSTLVDYDNILVVEDKTYYGIYDFNENVKLTLNSGSLTYNNTVYSSDTNIDINYDDKIIFSNLTKENFEFNYYEVKINSNETLFLKDIEFNKSLREVYSEIIGVRDHVFGVELPEIETFEIIVHWVDLRNEEEVLCYEIADLLGFNAFERFNYTTTHDFYCLVYEYMTGESGSDFSDVELRTFISSRLDIEYKEDDIEFLTLFRDSIKEK